MEPGDPGLSAGAAAGCPHYLVLVLTAGCSGSVVQQCKRHTKNTSPPKSGDIPVNEATGRVISRPFAGSRFHRPAMQLDDGTWYWISEPHDGQVWNVDPGETVRIRYVYGDQFCQIVAGDR
jgi:hypothetical protein